MDRSNTVELLSMTQTQDQDGIWQQSYTARTVFCKIDSVTRSEFFEAGRSGLNPEFRVTMFAYDYNGETLLKYDSKIFAIYRTYFNRNDEIELYCERQGGANGKGSQP